MAKKEQIYKWVRIAGIISAIPFILLSGPFIGYLAGDWIGRRFGLGRSAGFIFLGLGFIWSIVEVVRIILVVARSDSGRAKG